MQRVLPQIGDWSSLDELRDLQAKQVPQVLAWAARAPFYRARFGSGLPPLTAADLESLPLVTKQDLRDAYPFGMLAVDRAELATYHESSGTVGQSTPSYYTERDWVDLAERYARKWVGLTARDTLLVRTPYALMITGHLAQAAARLRGAMVVPADYRSLAMPYPRFIRALHNLGVTLTWSIPTEPLVWAAAARAAGLDPGTDFPSLRALFVAGEPLSAARRKRLGEIWGVPVVEEYGSTETGTLAGECAHGRMHLWADRALFEVYDPRTGRLSAEGNGQLVVTPLYREAMPLLRYNLEDDVEVSYADCPCGWQLPSVRVLGRASAGFPVGDRKVTQHGLEELVFSLPSGYGVLFWRARAEPAVLRVEIEVAEEHAAAARDELTAAITRELAVPCEVVPMPPGSLLPPEVLSKPRDIVKPRTLWGADEDWNQASLYN
ncbi:AMP-binding protein [Amycolatopsis aidingensis]|uniref:AMP-binding protein n=1 Tax=Amycolatopsis aidingensis TaxID=2842453 RepID=UPI001C0D771E|nr:AMP-binding protein [Amycolatopsis aidingensis]